MELVNVLYEAKGVRGRFDDWIFRDGNRLPLKVAVSDVHGYSIDSMVIASICSCAVPKISTCCEIRCSYFPRGTGLPRDGLLMKMVALGSIPSPGSGPEDGGLLSKWLPKLVQGLQPTHLWAMGWIVREIVRQSLTGEGCVEVCHGRWRVGASWS